MGCHCSPNYFGSCLGRAKLILKSVHLHTANSIPNRTPPDYFLSPNPTSTWPPSPRGNPTFTPYPSMTAPHTATSEASNSTSGELDASCFANINQMLQNVTTYPNGTAQADPSVLLAYCRVYLYENGRSQLIQVDLCDNTTLGWYLNSLLDQANVRLNSVQQNYFDGVLTRVRAVAIVYRTSTMQFGGQNRFYAGYFMPSDPILEGMVGRIVTHEVDSHGYALWEIAN